MASWGTDEPTVAGQGVVDAFADTDRACLVIVWVFCVASLEGIEHKWVGGQGQQIDREDAADAGGQKEAEVQNTNE